jgi:hypothetical protein
MPATNRFAELQAQTQANKTSAMKSQAASAQAKRLRGTASTMPAPVAPKVQPNQYASSIFGAVKGLMGKKATVEEALAPKTAPARNTRGW